MTPRPRPLIELRRVNMNLFRPPEVGMIHCHTVVIHNHIRACMSKTKIAITIERPILERIDQLVAAHMFSNRSRAIEQAIEEKLERVEHGRLARECAKLVPAYEQALADEGLSEDTTEWPEY